MYVLNFSELHRSLLEIQFELIHANNTSTKEIVELSLFASSRMCVYSQNLWTGKVAELWTKAWTWWPWNSPPCKQKEALDFIFSTVFQNAVNSAYQCRRNRMIHCVRSINNAFNPSKEQINHQKNHYRIDLQEELPLIDKIQLELFMEDYSSTTVLNENDLISMRHNILRFHEATMKFWRFYISRKKDADQRKLLYYPILQYLKPDSHFFNRSLYKSLIYEGRWVILEGKLQQSIPFMELAKLNHPHLLKEKDRNCLKKWIEKINACHETIPSKLFLGVIIEVAKLLKIQGSSSLSLFNLVFWLKKEKCIFLKKNDPHQLRRGIRLKSGETIQCNHKNYKLGKYLGKKQTHRDNYHYYELENTNYVVEVPNNCFRSFLRTFQEKNYSFHWGTKLVKTIDVHPKGHFAILEKLPFFLKEHIWTSEKLQLNETDRELTFILANHFHLRIYWNRYSKLSLKNLGRNAKGNLKAIYPTKIQPPNYNHLEWDCLITARGNYNILCYLMSVPKTVDYPIAHYYQEEVIEVFSTGRLDTRTNPIPRDYDQHFYQMHTNALRKHAFEIFEECLKQVIHVFNYAYDEHSSKLRKEVGERLIQAYQTWPAPGFLPPYLVQMVVDSFKNENNEYSVSQWDDYTQRIFEYYSTWPETGFVKKSDVRKTIKAFKKSPKNTSAGWPDYRLEIKYYQEQFNLLVKANEAAKKKRLIKLSSKNKIKTR